MAALLLLPLLLLPAAASKECDIVQYGAKSDGTTDSTRAIQHALDACAGGTVRVPAPSAGGDHLSYRAGSLQLRSHQRLVVEPGAMLEGLTDARAYPIGAPFPSFCGTNEGTQADCRGSCALPFLGAEGVTDVEITGGGTIDGGSPTGHFRGPRLIQFRNSSALRITNVTVQHSAFWTIHFYGCNDVAVTDSRIVAGITVGETDGVDLDSTSNAYIARNHIEVGDDGVALKSGMGACGRAFATPTTNVTIEHNFFNFSGGVAIGSEMSGGVRDITVRHNVLRGDSHRQPHLWTWGPRVLTIKSDRGRGGVVENVLVLNTTCIDCDQIARITMGGGGSRMLSAAATPIVRNVTVQLVRGTVEEPGFFQGLPESPLQMNFIDVVVTSLRRVDEYGSNTSKGYDNCSALSPYGIGLRNSPPVCSLTEHERYLPNVWGGAAAGAASDLIHSNQFPSGVLFAFSGIDGQTDTPSKMMGWYSDHAYSVYLWLTQARLLELGFISTECHASGSGNCSVTEVDPELDRMVYATNDAMMVERAGSRLAVTWQDRHTIVGFIEGPLAVATLRNAAQNCGGDKSVQEFRFPAAVSAQVLRWLITKSVDGDGPTICFMELLIDGNWTNSERWNVSAAFHPNGPVQNLMSARSCDAGTFWNSDDGTSGWNVTITMDRPAASVEGFRYGIWRGSEAPKSFEVQAQDRSQGGAFRSVLSVADTATASNCSRLGKARVSISSKEVLAFDTYETDPDYGVTQFALCYSAVDDHGGINAASAAATACATAAARADVAAVLAERNEYIAQALPPLKSPSDDRFQRKLLSVMKVNSLSSEGAIHQGWSTTCRAPHQDMFLWDGMMQTIAMNHVDPNLSLQYIRSFLQFQDNHTGSMCSQFGPSGCLSHTDAMPPNMCLAVVDWYSQIQMTASVSSSNSSGGSAGGGSGASTGAGEEVLRELFPRLEAYITFNLDNRRDSNGTYKNLLFWHGAYEAGMDHEQTFCPGKAGDLIKDCRSDHYAVDFTAYMIWECQALSDIATVIGMTHRAQYWNNTATVIRTDMIKYLWDGDSQFFYDRYFNGTMMTIKTVAGFYPLLASGMPEKYIKGMATMLKAKDFATAVPIPTVGVFTDDFSSDLDRGPMWEQQNFYVIRGLRKYGRNQEADALKAVTLEVVRHYYEQWGAVFEFYDAKNTTDPTQCLRKPSVADSGPCKRGVIGVAGKCGSGGIRDYNFCAGLALLWLRGGE